MTAQLSHEASAALVPDLARKVADSERVQDSIEGRIARMDTKLDALVATCASMDRRTKLIFTAIQVMLLGHKGLAHPLVRFGAIAAAALYAVHLIVVPIAVAALANR